MVWSLPAGSGFNPPAWCGNLGGVGWDNHHVVIGNDHDFTSGNGMLMPSNKNQAPPDLRYCGPRK